MKYLLSCVFLTFFLSACDNASRDDSGVVIESGDIDVFSMRVGDCFNDVNYEVDVYDVPGIPCSEPHDNEVFAIYDTTLATFPGGDEMSDIAFEECIAYFEEYVGRDYPSSMLDVFPITPTLESWNQANDREINCALFQMDSKKLEGTMKNSKL